jgi:hypothetical protein
MAIRIKALCPTTDAMYRDNHESDPMAIGSFARRQSLAPRLLDQMRDCIRYKHYSLRTEKAYLFWVRHFIRFHGLTHPKTMGGPEIEGYLTHLATVRKVAPSTHKQALAAILFLYRDEAAVLLAALWLWSTPAEVPDAAHTRCDILLSPTCLMPAWTFVGCGNCI